MYLVWQIYSTTRIFTLVAVILTLVGVDDTARYNCEVRLIHTCFICGGDLIRHGPKVKTVFLLVSKPFRCTVPNLKGNNAWHAYIFWSLVIWVSSHCLRFSLDLAPHVRSVSLIRLSSLELSTYGYYQYRHLEQDENYNSDRSWRLGNQLYIPDSV